MSMYIIYIYNIYIYIYQNKIKLNKKVRYVTLRYSSTLVYTVCTHQRDTSYL